MAFGGWPEEALDFYEGLAADNSKTYWTKHKQTYDAAVLRPMTELVEELAPEFGETKIFRPYRDVRFSKDKTPYKTHVGALVGSGYVQLSARGLAAGDGMYGMAPTSSTGTASRWPPTAPAASSRMPSPPSSPAGSGSAGATS